MAEPLDIYTNQTVLQITPWDFAVRFGLLPVKRAEDATAGQIEAKSIEEEVIIENIGTVRMSHVQAKVIAVLMRRIIKSWEESEGEIKIPNSIARRNDITDEDW